MKRLMFYTYLGLLIGMSFLSTKAVSTCPDKEVVRLNKLAYNIKTDYEPVLYHFEDKLMTPGGEIPEETDTYYRMHVNIYNLAEDLRLVVNNKYSNTSYAFNYSDSIDNVLSLDAGMALAIKNIEIKVYGTGDCYTKEFRTINIQLPKYNNMATYEICKEIPDYYMCKMFVNTDVTMTEMEFNEKAKAFKLEKEKEEEEIPIVSFFQKYWKSIAIVGGIVVIGGAVSAVIIVRKKRRRLV